MGFPKVKNFLCCCNLETGGLIIGWINLIISFLVLFGLITGLSLIVAGVTDYDTGHNSVIGSTIVVIITFSIFIVYYLIAFVAALMLIQGVKRRDHSKMVLFMILMIIGVVLQFLQVLTAGWATFISALFLACLSAYWFICIYSLYDKIRSEKLGQPQPYA